MFSSGQRAISINMLYTMVSQLSWYSFLILWTCGLLVFSFSSFMTLVTVYWFSAEPIEITNISTKLSSRSFIYWVGLHGYSAEYSCSHIVVSTPAYHQLIIWFCKKTHIPQRFTTSSWYQDYSWVLCSQRFKSFKYSGLIISSKHFFK